MKSNKHQKRSGKKTAPAVPDNNKREWLLIGLILVLTFLIFSPALKGDFVNWDDDVNVTNNENVKTLSSESVKNMFTQTVIGGYTPLTTLSFALEHHFFGLDAGVFHLNNLLLHLLCTALVFFWMRQLGLNLFVAAVATLLFGIHPMRVESVAWITERKDVLYSCFFLLSLMSYTAFRKSNRRIFYFLSLLVFVLSLLSKIQAVSLPLILILIDYFFEGKFRLRQLWNKIPFFLLSLTTGLAGIYFLGQEGSLETNTVLPFHLRIFIGTYSLCVYLLKAVIPYEMSAIYPYPDRITAIYYASAAAVAALALVVYKLGKQRKELVFGVLFFLFNVVFMLQVVGAGQGFIADRFTYLPYIGLFFLMAWLPGQLLPGKWKTPAAISAIIYLLLLGGMTYSRTKVWENSETLFTDVLKKYPNVAVAYNNLGRYYRVQNQYEKAIAAYDKSIGLDPEGYLSYSNRGKAYFDLGEMGKALTDMNKALEINPDFVEALSNRGAAHASRKNFDLALNDLDKALSLNPRNLNALSNRTLLHYTLGNFDKAIQDITSYLAIQPADADLLNLRALSYSQLNKNREALADFNQAIQLKPQQGVFYQNRSYLLNKLGERAAALQDIQKARELGIQVNPEYLKLLQPG